ncbi:addiction module toxin RelE [Anaerotignum sp.]|uniref:addiction module toxin RelE n=1 Tax=Anaerotignum sp. TaxID=2039241 RepID=UPI00289B2D10|nr:addiction module toxin RelE [Anaerotignum sp.]
MTAPKKKKLTQREKADNARFKKEMQKKGILPPDKPKLNRKKFAKEVITEWENTEGLLYSYVMNAIMWMIPGKESRRPVTPEEVGALKVLKLALEIKKFESALPEGTYKYSTNDLFEKVINPILKL